MEAQLQDNQDASGQPATGEGRSPSSSKKKSKLSELFKVPG